MSKFIYFTPEQRRQANEVDLPSFLHARGEKLLLSGREYRLAGDHSITVRGSKWFDHSSRKGGRAISFVQTYYDKNYPDAVSMLLGGTVPAAKPEDAKTPKSFVLPPPYSNMRRVYAYLMQKRGISREVISAFARDKLLYEDEHHNCVFVGVDEHGKAKHAHIRSTNSEGRTFRMNAEGSEAKHSFHKNGTDKSLYVFEAPIDLMSHMVLYPHGWLEHCYVACYETSIQPVLERLRQNPKLDIVYLCLDNDESGEEACERMTDTLTEMGLEVERLRPQGKDWNEDLCMAKRKHKKEDVS